MAIKMFRLTSGTGTGTQTTGRYLGSGQFVIHNVSVRPSDATEIASIGVVWYNLTGSGNTEEHEYLGSGFARQKIPYVLNGPIPVIAEYNGRIEVKSHLAGVGFVHIYVKYEKVRDRQ